MSETAKDIARSLKFSSIPKEAMVDFMELNPKLRRGKYDKEFTTKMAEKLWNDLSDFLNTLPGGQKEPIQWRKTWQDLKTTVKSKSSEATNNSNKTGGGRTTAVPLTAIEERVKSLTGVTSVKGDPGIRESNVNMNWEASPTNISGVQRINNQMRQDVLTVQDDVHFTQSTSNHRQPTSPIRAPQTTENTAPSPTPSSFLNFARPSPTRRQQDTRQVRRMGQTQVNQQITSCENENQQMTSSPTVSLANNNPTVNRRPSRNNPSPTPSSFSNFASPSPTRRQQDRSQVPRISQTQVNPSINYLRNILSASEQTGENENHQMTSSPTVSLANNNPTVNRPPSRNNLTCRSTNSDLSQRHSPNAPYSRHRPSTSSPPNANINAFFDRSQRPTRVATQRHKPRRIATQRFEKTIDASDHLIVALQEKTEMKERYYQHKLKLMDDNVKAQEGIAAALTEIACIMKQN